MGKNEFEITSRLIDQNDILDYEARGRDILVTVHGMQDLASLPDSAITQGIPKPQLELLAGASDKELENLARKAASDEIILNDREAEPSMKLGKITAEPTMLKEPNKELFRVAFQDYLELRAKAQTLLGWELPGEELN